MKIVKFTKDKNNIYKVCFDDDTVIDLYDDVIIKYNLLSNKVMDDKKFKEITDYNDFLNGYYKSIKYINKKLRSELEIEKYLKKLEVKESDIKKIIKLLYSDGYLNKEMYIKAYINDKFNLSSYGPLKIEKDLLSLGYSLDEFYNYLYSLDWNSRINSIIVKKIKLNHKLSNSNLKYKIINEIINLGYKKEDIVDELSKIIFEDDYDVLKKELIKIQNKYTKKYSSNELEYKITNYLFNKGFKLEDIKRCYNENKIRENE